MATVISIGRNVGEEPMHASTWDAFTSDVFDAAERFGAVVFYGQGTGVYEGAVEDSYTIVIDDSEAKHNPRTGGKYSVDALRAELRDLATQYGQEAIALTRGETEFVPAWPDVDDGPEPRGDDLYALTHADDPLEGEE